MGKCHLRTVRGCWIKVTLGLRVQRLFKVWIARQFPIFWGAALPTRSRRCDRFLHTSRGVLGKRANCVKKAKLIEMA